MSRLVAVIAFVAGLVVIAAMATGEREVAVSIVISVHLLSVAILAILERRIGGRGAVSGIAERNRRRVTWFVVLGCGMILVARFLPTSQVTFASIVLASAATAFNLGAFAIETVSILAQWRLLSESRAERSAQVFSS